MNIPRLCLLLLLFLIGELSAAEIHVAAKGDDAKSGVDKAQAVRSIEKGLALVRGLAAPRKLVLHEGTYEAAQIVLTAADSGLEICAAPGEKPRLLGGRVLRKWTPDGNGLMAAPAPGTQDRSWDFRALVANGNLAPRARLPETGWLKHESQFNAGWNGEQEWKGADKPETKDRLKYRAEDKAAWMDGHNAELTILHEWDDSLVGVARHDGATRTLYFTNPAGNPPGAWKHYDYCVWNVREGMTAAGQWYLDRDREVVVYRPKPGENPATMEIAAPLWGSVIVLRGAAGKPVDGVRISGLTISCTTPPLATGGWGGGAYPGAVEMEQAANCVVERCSFLAIGGQAVRSTHGKDNRFIRNTVKGSGTGGIYSVDSVGESIADNTVQDIGQMCNGAIGIRAIGNGYGEAQLVSHHNLVEHNLIIESPYAAVEFGGQFNRYQFNRVEGAMRVLVDGAAIYGAGRDNLIAGNLVQGVRRGVDKGCHAIYNDENGTRVAIVGNWVFDCDRPLMNHRGIDDAVVSNIFAAPAKMRIMFVGGSAHRIENTAIVAGEAIDFDGREQTRWINSAVWSVSKDYPKGVPEGVRQEDLGFAAQVVAKTWKAAGEAVKLTGLVGDPSITGPRPEQLTPVIILQPRPVAVAAGQIPPLACLATGNPSPAMHWERQVGGEWKPLDALPILTIADNGAMFRLVATNPHGSITSEPAIVTVR